MNTPNVVFGCSQRSGPLLCFSVMDVKHHWRGSNTHGRCSPSSPRNKVRRCWLGQVSSMIREGLCAASFYWLAPEGIPPPVSLQDVFCPPGFLELPPGECILSFNEIRSTGELKGFTTRNVLLLFIYIESDPTFVASGKFNIHRSSLTSKVSLP